MDINEHKPGLLELGQHGFKLGDGGHVQVIARGVVVAVKGFVRVHNETVEENMVELAVCIGDQLGL